MQFFNLQNIEETAVKTIQQLCSDAHKNITGSFAKTYARFFSSDNPKKSFKIDPKIAERLSHLAK